MNFSGSVGQNFFASSAPSHQPPIYPRCWMGVGENFLSSPVSDCMNFSGCWSNFFRVVGPLTSLFRVAGWVTLYRLIHSQSTLSFLFSKFPSFLLFDRVQAVEMAFREVSITTKLLIAWFTSTRGVYQFRTVKPVHFFRAKESLLIHLIHELCMPVSDSNHSGYIITTLCQLSEWQREDKQESKSLIIRG